MEEAADTSSAGPLVTCLFPDNHDWDDGALKDLEEPVSIDAYVCVCVYVCVVTQGICRWGVLWGEG